MSFNKKNILPELSDTVINGSKEFYESSEELMEVFQGVSLDVINFFIELDETKSSGNVLKELTNKYINLNNTDLKINSVELPNNFKLYLNEKFQNLLYLFKATILKQVSNLEQSIYSNYSDDIGMTLEQNNNLGLTNTPIFDSYYQLEKFGAPITIPPVMINKVSIGLMKNFKKMSLKNDAILKTSLRNIAAYGTEDISKTPHGANLVYDNFYKVTKDQLTNMKTEKIIEVFGENLGDLITFYKNLNIRDQEGNKSYLISYQNNIEGVQNVLDMFSNNIYSTTTLNIPFTGN
tara:strand:+ start:3325 stop:4200 length:876 start_codon:yes stop_codon:yes gene_type:complete